MSRGEIAVGKSYVIFYGQYVAWIFYQTWSLWLDIKILLAAGATLARHDCQCTRHLRSQEWSGSAPRTTNLVYSLRDAGNKEALEQKISE